MLSRPDTCRGCPLDDLATGFMAPSGTGANGVLIVGEALGEEEAAAGSPFVGKAGYTLDKIITRGGMRRDDFTIANAVWCRPPFNKLAGAWYLQPALDHCRQYLDGLVARVRPRCIVGLGGIAAASLIPTLPASITKVKSYVFWSDRYQTWVIPSIHPSFIMRGQTAWAQVLMFDLQHAIEIARDGFSYPELDYTLDCTPKEALEWVDEFEQYYGQHPDLYLSADIETPGKDADEEDLDLEESQDYLILRCGYSYREGHALSIPWGGQYQQVHARLLAGPAQKVFWNGGFDAPRIRASNIVIGGDIHDAMDAWHVLNSDQKKSLGYVAPFFAKRYPCWKHTANDEPAKYNAMDADIAGICMRGTVELLKKHGLWNIYKEFICKMDVVFASMTKAGMPINITKRQESAKAITTRHAEVLATLDVTVPQTIKPFTPKKGYVKPPADLTGLTEVVFDGVKQKVCERCGMKDPKKPHFAAKKRSVNPCAGSKVITIEEGTKRWVRMAPFVPSPAGILKYQKHQGHSPVFVGQGAERHATTDEKALRTLIGRHPKDEVYPLVLEYRELSKVGGTYIGWWDEQLEAITGGLKTGIDGRIHGHYRHNPSTLRSSMVGPNLQNIPRGDDSEVQRLVKQMFEAPHGYTFVARDFSGIEAVLVGYHANSPTYTRLAKIDVHSYFTAHRLYSMGILTAADLPDLTWSDADLIHYFKDIKNRFGVERNIGKRCIHAGNYLVGAKLLHDTYPTWFPKIKDASLALGLYFEVFPEIPTWHARIGQQVDKTGVIKNSFGHVHRFYHVLQWRKRGGHWISEPGPDLKRVIAFGPQSDAAFIGKRAGLRLYYDYPDTMAQWLRLFIHDEWLAEVPQQRAEEADDILRIEMEKPIPEMPLCQSWGMGSHLAIGSEGKMGTCWAYMT
jgi:DNA polymerase